ncbi:unnamed protein product [Strongylus vulgaris]|uniref:Uncharacterized protein n=1 Tax=Strongylus vulgaris TaxID=40348 RepID=A0A3P7KET4_STRVU|nr:unnamed protein product [Strongylus vulgaris]
MDEGTSHESRGERPTHEPNRGGMMAIKSLTNVAQPLRPKKEDDVNATEGVLRQGIHPLAPSNPVSLRN